MSNISSNNKRIAKNSVMLYIRMFMTMGIALYTSRVVLQVLGASDYGLYNIVGGFVSMLAYLNSAFVGATQRFFSFAIGKGDKNDHRIIFGTSIITHLCIAIIILFIAETFGLWFINNKLNIDSERLLAANWVFQCSLGSLMLTIVKIPFDASIIAHEHMSFFAYLSIADVLLKLVIVYLLVLSPFDSLVSYAFLLLLVSLLDLLASFIYCRYYFEECHRIWNFSRKKFSEMVSFAGWVLVGNLGFAFKDQLSNIILNLFFGTIINAARGLAAQVNAQIIAFANNFFLAMSPQVTKQYAAGNIEQSTRLVYAGAKFTFLMMTLITIPVILNLREILNLWLNEVPDYTYEFLVITLIASLIGSMAKSSVTAIQATGKMKIFQIGISLIMLLEIPIAYLLLRMDYSPYHALLPAIFTNIIGVAFRFCVLKYYVPQYSYSKFLNLVVFRSLSVFIVAFLISMCLSKLLIDGSLLMMLLDCIISAIVVLVVSFVLGLSVSERGYILSIIRIKIIKR